MGRIRLVTFDLDGTLTRGPTVCEALAARLGRSERMRELETHTPLDDPHAARAEMASWYRGVPAEALLGALEEVPPAPGAAEGIARLRAAGVTVAIASLTWLFAVRWFAGLWGIDHCAGTGLTEGGEITHLFAEDKATWTLALGRRRGIGPDAMAAVGDSDGDLPLLRAVGHPFFVGRALPPGLAAAHRPAADIAVLAGEILAL